MKALQVPVWRGLWMAAVGLSLSAGLLAQTAGERALAIAMSHFQSNARSYGLSDPARELKVRSVRNDALGYTVIRYDQFFQNVKVFEGEAIARVASNGTVSVTNSLRPNIAADVRALIDSNAALATAMRIIGARGPAASSSAALEVLPRGPRSTVDLLVWHVKLFIENDIDPTSQWDYFVDARSGIALWGFDSLETAASVSTGKTMYSGDVTLNTSFDGVTTYSLVDTTRSSSYTNDMAGRRFGKGTTVTSSTTTFGNNDKNNTDPDTAGADAHFGLASTWGYYLTTFGRNGIDGAGRKTYSRVHYSKGYENAYWSDSCFCMTYGDGKSYFYPLVSLDVAGHEMSHGVMASEAALTYSGESGGLNESNSDIFGTLVEFFANRPQDTPEYWIGERIMRSNYPGGVYTETSALRYMDDPHKDGTSPACWSSGIGGLDVHYSSGPNNHMFYLLSHGGTSKCNSNVVAGIGNAAAAAIWYRALTTYMTASTNYAAARTACLNAAADLYGNPSAERTAVAAAFSAINVN